MPELPEVETIRRDLSSTLRGATVARVRLVHDDILLPGGLAASPRGFAARLRGRRIRAVERRGKNLLLRVEGDLVVQAQVRMTGRFAVAAPGEAEARAAELGFGHVAAEFTLTDGRTLLYDDVRRLGGFRLLEAGAWAERERALGPEPLADGYRTRDLAEGLGTGRGPVKNALLDQSRVAGIGNIYASEALHRARIDPRRACRDLAPEDHRRLHRALRAVLRDALRGEGTTLRDYRAINGRSGRFQERLRVYGRDGSPCRRCGAPIDRIVQAGRSTFFCAACQA